MDDVSLQSLPPAFRSRSGALQHFTNSYPAAALASHLGADIDPNHAFQTFALSGLSVASQLQPGSSYEPSVGGGAPVSVPGPGPAPAPAVAVSAPVPVPVPAPISGPAPPPLAPRQRPQPQSQAQVQAQAQTQTQVSQSQQDVSQQSNHSSFKQPGGGLFGVLTPRPGHPQMSLSYQAPMQRVPSLQSQLQPHTPPLQSQAQPLQIHNSAIARQEQDLSGPVLVDQPPERADGHFKNLKLIPNPPRLKEWREKLFHVDDTIVLSEDEFNTYFPHVDNVYSHRSTQRYKRKPFISHYWDCRLKGRPPGTPKSDDPTKKKRKRTARERDLCDVKIKITEYFPVMSPEYAAAVASGPIDGNPASGFFSPDQVGTPSTGQPQILGVFAPGGNLPPGHPGAGGARYYTIQRVNGNGANGKADGTAGPHKHTLEESDRVKKNSVQRYFVKEEKERRKMQKSYHKRATGAALATVKRHSKESDLKLFGSCFCPFVQRIWISLEAKGISYQYIEVDPYKKPDALLEVNPRGLIPAVRHGDFCCYESSVLMEYLEDLNIGIPLLPLENAEMRAHCRLWADHVNRKIIPNFYKTLQAQDLPSQMSNAEDLKQSIAELVDHAADPGPFFFGAALSFVDVQFAPWMLRLSRVLKPYRGWPDPEAGSRWAIWVDAIETNEAVKATTSTDELYLDSYERYAENRPNTSQLADAINNGTALP